MNSRPISRGSIARLATRLLAITFLVTLGRAPAWSEDRVFLKTPSGQGESRVVGEVEEFTGVELVVRHRGGRQQSFESARVIRIESDWSRPHQLGRAKFQQRQYQESLDAYLEALRAEKRKWVQRQQLGQITWCYRNLGKLELASASFLALYRSDPTTPHIAAIPLIWNTRPTDAAMERRAATLLADARQPAGQLIAASWLLTTARRAEAIQTLGALTNAADARLIFLAEAQTWRTQLATLSDTALTRMVSRIDAMPSAIRCGPYFLLGAAQARQGQPSQAALAWMRIPINFPADRRLAAEALLAAGGELATINRPAEARELYREIIVDYAETPAATTAQQRHAALSATQARHASPDRQPAPPGN